jgi:general secretion pathway protein G
VFLSKCTGNNSFKEVVLKINRVLGKGKYMSNWLFRHLWFGRQKKEGFKNAFTLVELVITIGIVGTLGAIAIPTYTDYIQKNANNQAIVDITNIESQIEGYRALNGSPPATLATAGIVPPLDPWGHAYIYVRPGNRWDKYDKPLNPDYDLLSMGRDGQTDVKLFNGPAFDDIIRCNGGAYIGLASKY